MIPVVGSEVKNLLTIPVVLDKSLLKLSNSSPTTITNFVQGREYQELKIFSTNGNTVIANNTFIKTNTGTNKALSTNKVYRFTRINSIWIEDA